MTADDPLRDELPADWRAALADRLPGPDMARLGAFLRAEEAAGRRIYPPAADRFRAFALTPLAAVRAVILGQDPYHGPGQAHGLSFSVPPGVRPPPSLRNILRELEADLGVAPPAHGSLEAWARQGVLLLNSALTVEDGRAASHRGRGWELFSDAVIRTVSAKTEPVAFLLWGAHAQQKAALVDERRHLVLAAPHPSPLSAYKGWFGSRPFSRANAFLRARGRGEIDWRL